MDLEDRQALGELLELLQERREQPAAGFWGKAWYQVQRYLSLNEDGAQQQEGEDLAAAAAAAGLGGGAAAAAAAAEPGSKRSLREVTSVEPAPIAQLPPAEQAALKNILEPIRKDQINKLQQRLADLAGGEVGVLPVGLAGPEAGGLGQQDQVNAAAAAAAANAMMMQNMGYANYLNDPNFWMYGGMADAADEGYGDMVSVRSVRVAVGVSLGGVVIYQQACVVWLDAVSCQSLCAALVQDRRLAGVRT
jgi:hypothetical protein